MGYNFPFIIDELADRCMKCEYLKNLYQYAYKT